MTEEQREAAKLATVAAWQSEKWENFEQMLEFIPVDDFDGAFFRAVSFIKKQNFDVASEFIKKARLILQPSLTRNYQQSYNRAYNDLYHAQLLAELEEVMHMRCAQRDSIRRKQIHEMWEQRLVGLTPRDSYVKMEGVRPNIENWQKILLVRRLDQVMNKRRYRSSQSDVSLESDDIWIRKIVIKFHLCMNLVPNPTYAPRVAHF